MRVLTHTKKKMDLSSIYTTHNEYVNQKEKIYGKKKCNYDKDSNVVKK